MAIDLSHAATGKTTTVIKSLGADSTPQAKEIKTLVSKFESFKSGGYSSAELKEIKKEAEVLVEKYGSKLTPDQKELLGDILAHTNQTQVPEREQRKEFKEFLSTKDETAWDKFLNNADKFQSRIKISAPDVKDTKQLGLQTKTYKFATTDVTKTHSLLVDKNQFLSTLDKVVSDAIPDKSRLGSQTGLVMELELKLEDYSVDIIGTPKPNVGLNDDRKSIVHQNLKEMVGKLGKDFGVEVISTEPIRVRKQVIIDGKTVNATITIKPPKEITYSDKTVDQKYETLLKDQLKQMGQEGLYFKIKSDPIRFGAYLNTLNLKSGGSESGLVDLAIGHLPLTSDEKKILKEADAKVREFMRTVGVQITGKIKNVTIETNPTRVLKLELRATNRTNDQHEEVMRNILELKVTSEDGKSGYSISYNMLNNELQVLETNATGAKRAVNIAPHKTVAEFLESKGLTVDDFFENAGDTVEINSTLNIPDNDKHAGFISLNRFEFIDRMGFSKFRMQSFGETYDYIKNPDNSYTLRDGTGEYLVKMFGDPNSQENRVPYMASKIELSNEESRILMSKCLEVSGGRMNIEMDPSGKHVYFRMSVTDQKYILENSGRLLRALEGNEKVKAYVRKILEFIPNDVRDLLRRR